MGASSDFKARVLAAVDRSWTRWQQAPSVKEVMEQVGSGSSSHVSLALRELEADGELILVGNPREARRAMPRWVHFAIKGAVTERRGGGGL